ncbi:bifunctional folylpolyglutamate synthase/dihydrofolate synthase [Clostridium botulinum]|uniref:tetrahydrofolate synthase n=1 Tax=Clostridium botulinum (strain Hall / ATCC 3502 / NCTC 13319 / Type A) TaxID=441771 RepID=A5I6P2_CLOBH|nr:folylpolyglutamate synthase/dihydrofolate synthase family protein [Clostridium botulinum]ABS33055.1 FolC bifunctional protein [Clostridium botulinum A str. ATCC 19397]ABS38769.1 FolC bifunctional protein [Clostridium botulinum A str. Hall]AWB18975.1 bifunctional folylpolyglutamate synthase/dihydrofolate synthase [Clostridium botulinum]AWB31788.1 bifunctional folylpolyglutamate synthase/dihydrofolate synthase [Clostridium botulinum]EGT5617027.1 bifunctional folylpolyglutamate synthase/dihydr
MDYKEAREYIQSKAKFGSNLGLERTEKLLELLGNPHKRLRCIHIAGTNGKGSTTAMISAVLKESGYKVGMYTSPYIEEFEERIQINGHNITKEDLGYIITKVANIVEKVENMGYGNPTEFEIITVAMFYYFCLKEVDFAVIEVGLGGRLDSTNVLEPILSIITSISYDHMNILGETLEEITYEKAGIIKKAPVITYPQKKEVEKNIEKVCKEKNCELIKVEDNLINIEIEIIEKNMGQQSFKLKTKEDTYNICLSLLGEHQIKNCITVILALEKLMKLGIKIEKIHIISALKKVKWPARLEIVNKNPLTVIDGAHNIDGIESLKNNVSKYFKYNKLILILGILKDKQVEDMIKTLVPLADRVLTVAPHNDRGESSKELMHIVLKHNESCEHLEDYKECYDKAKFYCEDGDMILICGSLYMVGDMRKLIR